MWFANHFVRLILYNRSSMYFIHSSAYIHACPYMEALLSVLDGSTLARS